MSSGRITKATAALAILLAGGSTLIGAEKTPDPPPVVRVVFGGDVMIGRAVGDVFASDPESVFREVRFVISDSDLAVANLESPLTQRPHQTANPYRLEADPAYATYLDQAGFDLMSIANNHSGDAGPLSVLDTIEALHDVGIDAVGGGVDHEAAVRPVVVERNGLRLGFLAFDVSLAGLEAGDGPGIVWWDEAGAKRAVEEARVETDLVVVSIHGGVEYQPDTDPTMWDTAELLATWGVDVVWGHGPHLVQPVKIIDPDADGRPTVVATSLGNLVFDQSDSDTWQGSLLEIVASANGVLAYREGRTECVDRRVSFLEWGLPEGDAVALGLEWWSLARTADLIAPNSSESDVLMNWPTYHEVRSHAEGDFTGDGETDLVVSFRRVFRETAVNQIWPDYRWADNEGKSAHLGVYRPADLKQWWVAGTLAKPIETISACRSTLLVGYSGLDDHTVEGYAVLAWNGFGFVGSVELPGPGEPGCMDLDDDGVVEAVIAFRG